MPAVNYVMYDCSCSRTTATLQELHTWGKTCCSYYSRYGDRLQFEKEN